MTDIALHQLMYISRRREHVSDTEVLDGIVLPAMRKNRSLDVTGCLWFDAHAFVQILEGDQAVIDELFAAIGCDERHEDVLLLDHRPVSERVFERFAMRIVDAHDLPEMGELHDILAGNGRRARRRPTPPAAHPGFLDLIARFRAPIEFA